MADNHTTNTSKLLSGVAMGAMVLFLGSTAASAQDNSNSRRDAYDVQDEIIVTATKRETTIQDAPISVAVITGDFIEDYQIANLTDLQSFVPNLTVQKTFGNWAVRIRGLGSGVTNIAFDSSVSIFNDGVYCGRSRCLEVGYIDVGNVEVARGPQGALFGKSTVAGAISLTSARPTDYTTGYVKVGTELDHGGYLASGVISGAMSDNFRGRLAVSYEDEDGDIKNRYLNRKDGGHQSFAFRASGEWDITPDVELWAKYEQGNNKIDGNRIQLVKPGALAAPSSIADPATIETNYDDVKYVSTGALREEFDDSEQKAFSAILDANVFGDHKLSIIGGHWALDYNNLVDVDGVPEAILNTRLREDYKQNSIEARLVSPSGEKFEYIAGVMYHNSDTQTGQNSSFFDNFYKTVGVPGFVVDGVFGRVGAQATGVDRSFSRETDTISAYGQLAWNPTERISIIGDLRYTEETQDGQASATNIIYPDGYNHIVFPGAPFQGNPEFTFYQKRKDKSFDPSIRGLFDLTDEINVYAAYSEGSKPGGLKANDGALGTVFLGRVASDPTFLSTYTDLTSVTAADLKNGVTLKQGNGVFDFEDESAKNYELGMKSLFRNGDVAFNLTGFWMDFKNLQTSVYDPDLLAFLIGNAATARVKGLEFDSRWRAMDELTFTLSGAYTDAKFREYEGTQCTKGPDDMLEDPTCTDGNGTLSGRRIERAPKTEFNFGANWQSDLTNNLDFVAGADVYYSGDMYVRQDFDPDGYQDSFFKFNARAGLETENGWGVSVIGRNLGDERTIQHAFGVLSEFVAVSPGRTIILELSKNF